MNNNTNLIVAVVLSVLILMGFHFLYEQPMQEHYRQEVLVQKKVETVKPVPQGNNQPLLNRDAALAIDHRLPITTPQLRGTINLKGGRIDDLTLVQYRENVAPSAPPIILFSPADSALPHRAYFAEFSWLSSDPTLILPTEETVWTSKDTHLSSEHPLKLTWDNERGLSFERTLSVDDQFMLTITDEVRNSQPTPTKLFPFGLIRREGEPVVASSSTHEGPLGVIDGTLDDYKYKDIIESGKKVSESTGGWVGFTDKYWLAALIPPQNEALTVEFTYNNSPDLDSSHGSFQADFRGTEVSVASGASIEHVTRLFVGAKPLTVLDHYAEQYSIPHFDRAIDFGRFYWIAEPFLYLLDTLTNFLGSFALAILAFTVILKILTLPLSMKSYRSMAKMKALQPEMKRLQERFADDKARQGSEVLELYKREKVNPVSGCFPMLIQIPIFFALYKVLSVGIEMRQAPFYGWIKDMSIPDPSSVISLFGLVPSMNETFHQAIDYLNTLPSILTLFGSLPGLLLTLSHIGAWPLFMGASMFLQQRLSPQPPDKAQARVFMFMPIIFAFTMSQMPAGLVIYWTWSNLLSIGQQWLVLRQSGGSRKPSTG